MGEKTKLENTILYLQGLPNNSIITNLLHIYKTDKQLYQGIKLYRYNTNEFGIIDFDYIEKQVNKN